MRRLLSEQLEPRRLLAADLQGDNLSAALPVALQANQQVEIDATIGDGNHGSLDVDLFRIDLVAGQTVTIDVDAEQDDTGAYISGLDSYLRVFDSAGMELANNSTGTSSNDSSQLGYYGPQRDSYLSFQAPTSGHFYIGVSGEQYDYYYFSGHTGNHQYDPAVPGSGTASSTGAYKLQLIADTPAGPSLSISDAGASEEDGSISFIVSLSESLSQSVTFDYATSDVSATAPEDYTSTSGTLTFAPGELSKTISVPVIDDAIENEADYETFTVDLSNVSGVLVADGSAVGTITNNDFPAGDPPGDNLSAALPVALQANQQVEIDATIGDGNHGSLDVDLFRIDLVAGQTVTIDVDAEQDDSGAYISGLDSYLRVFDSAGMELANNSTGTSSNDSSQLGYYGPQRDSYLSFQAPTSGHFYIGVSGEQYDYYYFSGHTGNHQYDPAVPGSGTASSTGAYKLQLIADTPAGPSLSISDAGASEEDGSISFIVSLSESLSQSVTFDYATSDVSATAPEDYTSTSGTLTFAPGELSKTISVPVIDDAIENEADYETFTVDLSNVSGVLVADGSAVGTITNNDFPAGDPPGDNLSAALPVALQANQQVEIDATIGDGNHGSLDVDLFRIDLVAGQTVTIDVDAEQDDTGAYISGLDSYLRVFDSAGMELANNSTGTSSNDSSQLGYYGPQRDSYLSFQAPTSGHFYIGVSGEQYDYYYFSGHTGNHQYDPAVPGSGTASSTGAYKLQLIADTPSMPSVSLSNASVSEDGGSVDVSVTLSEAAVDSVTLDYATVDGTAASSDDYTSASGSLTFNPGETEKLITVSIVDDSIYEGNENLQVVISNAVGALISDGDGTVTILEDDNSPPTIAPIQDQTIAEDSVDQTFSVTVADLDTDLSSVTLSATSSDATILQETAITFSGSGANRTMTVTPEPNAHGTVTITLVANDGTDLSVPVSFSLDVTPVNDVPASGPNTVTTAEDQPYTFVFADFPYSDIDLDPLAWVTVTGIASSGVLSLSGSPLNAGADVSLSAINSGQLTYSPPSDAFGAGLDSFTFTVSDGQASSAESVMTIDVDSLNDAPTTLDHELTISESTSHTFSVADFPYSDVESDPIAGVELVSVPQDGTLSLNGNPINAPTTVAVADIASGLLIFSPSAGASGTPYTSFDFKVSDGSAVSTTAVMTFNVLPFNDIPAIESIADGSAAEDTTYGPIQFTVNDPDGPDPITLTATSSHQSLVADGDIDIVDLGGGSYTLTATPLADAFGSTTIEITASDGLATDTESFVLTFAPVNDLPTIASISDASGREDTTFGPLTLTISDVDDPLSSLIVSGSSSNTSLVDNAGISFSNTQTANPTLSITPQPGASGQTTISVIVDDGTGSTVETFVLTIVANQVPTTADSVKTIDEDGSLTFAAGDFPFNDLDSDPLVGIEVLSLPGNGSLTLDGVTLSGPTSVTKAQLDGGLLVFSPAPNANGQPYATFDFAVDDGSDASASAVMTVNVTAVNDAPSTDDVDLFVDEDQTHIFATANFTYTDVESDPLGGIQIQSLPTAGSLILGGVTLSSPTFVSKADLDNGQLRFRPVDDESGTPYTTFDFSVSDGTLLSNMAKVTIHVAAVNDPPVIVPISDATIREDGTYGPITLTVNDVDHSLASLTLAGDSANTAVVANSGITFANTGTANPTLTITPVPGASGDTVITVSVSDGESTVQTDFVLSVAANQIPATANTSVTIDEDQSHTFVAADFPYSDGDLDPMAGILVQTLPTQGTLFLDGNALTQATSITKSQIDGGALVYVPPVNANGVPLTSFDFAVKDSFDDSAPAVMTINVNSVNDAPTSADVTFTLNEDTTYVFAANDFPYSDVESDPLEGVEILSLPAVGSLILAGTPLTAPTPITRAQLDSGSFLYQPPDNGNGAPFTTFEFAVSDALQSSGTATATFAVLSVNDAPSGIDTVKDIGSSSSYSFSSGDFPLLDSFDSPPDQLMEVQFATVPDAAQGTLLLDGNLLQSGAIVDAAALSTLTFTPAGNATTPSSFEFYVRDDGGTANGGVDWSTSPNTFIIGQRPSQPGGLTATNATHDSLSLSWNTSTHVAQYVLQRSLDNFNWTTIANVPETTTDYTDTGLDEATRYYYRVSATNAIGESAKSNSVNRWTLPNDPQGLTATFVSSTQVDFAWTDQSDRETFYYIEQSTNGGTSWSTIVSSLPANTESHSFNGSFLSDQEYHFRVRVYTYFGYQSSYSSVVSLTTPAFPVPPTGLSTTASSESSVSLVWADSDDETSYSIQRSIDNLDWSTIGTVPADTNQYVDTGLDEASRYYYRLVATNAHGDSVPSGSVSRWTFPNPADSLTATVMSSTQVDLTWLDQSSKEYSFYVEQSSNSGASWSTVTSALPVDTESVSVPGPFQGSTEYQFRIRVYTTLGYQSSYSEPVSVTTPAFPDQPTGLAVTSHTSDSIAIQWNDGAHESDYSIERSLNNIDWVLLGTVAADTTAYVDTGLDEATRYYYRVVASNAFGDSAPSSSVNRWTLPNAPDGLSATVVGSTQIDLTWTDQSSTETWYYVEQSSNGGINWSNISSNLPANTESFSAPGPFLGDDEYSFRVRVYSQLGNQSSYSAPFAITTPGFPDWPTGLSVSGHTSNSITLDWNDVDSETSYLIQRSDDNTTWSTIGTVAQDATTYTDTGLTEATRYYYRVIAANAIGDSAPSSSVNRWTLPNAPDGLTATVVSSTQIDVSWNDLSNSEQNYYVEQSDNGGATWNSVGSLAANTISFSAPGPFQGDESYSFRVRVYDGWPSYQSHYSEPISVTTPAFPDQPTGLTAIDSTQDTVTLQWNDLADETSYRIERSEDGSTWTTIDTLSADVTSYTDTSLDEATRYYFRVIAANAIGDSAPSSFTNRWTLPNAPDGLTATVVSSTQIDVSWNDLSNSEQNYYVEQSDNGGATWNSVGSLAANTISFSAPGPFQGDESYSFRVRVYDGWPSYQSNYSEPISVTTPAFPDQPTGLTAIDSTQDTVTLQWNDLADETSFRIERSEDGSTWTTIDTLPADVTSYNDTSLDETTRYYYRVIAANAIGDSAPSSSTYRWTLPNAPDGLTATVVSSTQIDVSWNDLSNSEQNYYVEQSDNGGVTWNSVGSLAANTISFSAPGPFQGDESYSFRVRVYDGWPSYQSNYSEPISVTTPAFPDQPTGLTAIDSTQDTVTLQWNDLADETSFRIERSEDGSTWTTRDTLAADVTSYTDTSLDEATRYYYRVIAANAIGDSAPSSSTYRWTLPNAPDGLTATVVGGGQIDVSWNDLSNSEQNYYVEQSDNGGMTWNSVGSLAANTISFSAPGPFQGDESYSFRVRVYDGWPSYQSNYSEPISVTTPAFPDQPVGLTATAVSDDSVALQWGDSDDETGYEVYRSLDSLNWTSVGTLPVDVVNFTDTGLQEVTRYYYRLVATNALGDSAPSNVVNSSTPTIPPSGLTATAVGATQIDLSWNDQSDRENQYVVQQSDDGGTTWSTIATLPTNSTNFTATGPFQGNQEYTFRVGSYDWSSSQYSYSANHSVTTPVFPDQPHGLNFSANEDSITLTWNDVEDETSYLVQRSTDNTSWNQIGALPANTTTFVDQGLPEATSYFYRVQANNSLGLSAHSDALTAFTTPIAPDGLSATFASATKIDLTWSDRSSKEIQYHVQQSDDGGTTWESLAILSANVITYSARGPFQGDQPYLFRVKAFANASSESYSAPISLTTPAYPDQPTGLTVSATSEDTLSLQWNDLSDETEYVIHRSTNGTSWSILDTLAADTTSYIDSGLDDSKRYHYFLVARNTSGDSAPSESVNSLTQFNGPDGLTATTLSPTEIQLDWNDHSSSETFYRVESNRDAATNWIDESGNLAPDTTQFVATIVPNENVSFRVVASDAHGRILYSNVLNLVTTPPQEPTDLTIVDATTDDITLSWDDVAFEDSYRLERSDDQTNWSVIDSVLADTTNSFIEEMLDEATRYYYRVIASNSQGDSAPSDTVFRTTGMLAPTDLTATVQSPESVLLEWTDHSNTESGFSVQRAESASGPWVTVTGSVPQDEGSYLVESLQPNTNYFFRVRAKNSVTSSSYSNVAEVNTPNVADAPTDLATSSVSNTQVELTWTAAGGSPTDYRIERSDDFAVSFSPIATIAASNLSYLDTTLDADELYVYRVVAIGTLESLPSDTSEITTTSDAPIDLAASSITADAVALSWTRPAGDTSLMLVERLEDGDEDGVWDLVATSAPIDGESYTAEGLQPDTAYRFQLRVETASGLATPSLPIDVTTSPLDTPTDVAVTVVSNTQVSVDWTDNSSGTLSQRIERSSDGGSTYSTVATLSAGTESYLMTDLAPGTDYQIRVVALAGASTSASAPVALATTATSPTGLSATQSASDEVTLTWSRPSGDSSLIEIEFSTDGVSFTPVATVDADTATVTSLVPGTLYFFRVRASTPGGTGTYSNVVSPPVTSITAPSGITVSAISNTIVQVQWTDNSNNETGFRVEASTDGGTTFTTVATTGINENLVDVTDLTPGEVYQFRVFATNGIDSPASGTSSLTTSADPPTSVTATGNTTTSIEVQWQYPVGDTSTSELEMSEDGVSFTVVDSSISQSSYVVDSLTSGTTYYFRVRVATAAGSAAYSAVVSAEPVEIAAPTNLTTSDVANTSLTIDWVPGGDPGTEQRIEYSEDSGATFSEVAVVSESTSSFDITGLEAGTNYQIRVIAFSPAGESDPSNVATVTTTSVAPSTITATPVTPTSILVSWVRDSGDESLHQVEIASGGTFAPVGAATRFGTSSSIIGLVPNTTYSFRIVVIPPSGVGGVSPTALATTPSDAPSIPWNVYATTGSATSIDLSWSSSPTAVSYTIEQREEVATTWTTVGTSGSTSFTANGLEPGGALYSYRVRATSGDGYTSPASEFVAARTDNVAPTITAPATAGSSLVTGTSTTLSVNATDDADDSDLIFTWSVVSGPGEGTASFSENESNAAKNATATFDRAGSYVLGVTAEDKRGLKATSTVSVTVEQTLTDFFIDQDDVMVVEHQTRPFTATALDQFGWDYVRSTVNWSLTSGDGSLDGDGVYTPPDPFEEGSFTVQAELDGNTVSLTGELKEDYDEIIDDIKVWHPESVSHVSGKLSFSWSPLGEGKPTLTQAMMGDSILEGGVGHYDGPTPVFEYHFAEGVLVNGSGQDFIFFAHRSTPNGFTVDVDGYGSGSLNGSTTPSGETHEWYWIDNDTPGGFQHGVVYSRYDLSDFGVPDGESVTKLTLNSPVSGDWAGIGAISQKFNLQLHKGGGGAVSEDDEDDPSNTEINSRDWLGAELSIEDFGTLEDGAYLTIHTGHEDLLVHAIGEDDVIETKDGDTFLLLGTDKLVDTPPRMQVDVLEPGDHYIELRYHKDDADTEGTVVDSVQFHLRDGGYSVDDYFRVTDYEQEGETWSLNVLDNDYKSGELTIESVSGVGQGTVTIQGSTLHYQPSLSARGWDVFTYTVSNSHGETFTSEVVLSIERPDLFREVQLGELDPAARAEVTAKYNDWLYRTAEKNFGTAVANELKNNYPTVSRPGGNSEPTLEWIARLIGKGWEFRSTQLSWTPWRLGLGGKDDIIDFDRDVNVVPDASGVRVIEWGTSHLYTSLFDSGTEYPISAADQARAIVTYVSNATVTENATGYTPPESPTKVGLTTFFSHPNVQFVGVAAAVAIAGPAGWAAAGALTSTFTVGGVTLTAAGLGQASVAVGSAWALTRATDNAVGQVVDSDGDGVGDRTFGQSLVDATTGDQAYSDTLLKRADIAVMIVEVGPGIFQMVRGTAGFATRAALGSVKHVRSLGQNVPKLINRDTYCFAPETLVSTDHGPKPIGELEAGATVLAMDFVDGEVKETEVNAAHHNRFSGNWVTVTLQTDSEDTVEVTENHPFWVVRGEDMDRRQSPDLGDDAITSSSDITGRWVFSHDLRRGDVLLTSDGEEVTVLSVRISNVTDKEVCNLTIAEHHSYFVSALGLLVHNISFCDELVKYLRRTGQSVAKPATLIAKAKELGYANSAVHAHHIVMKTGKGVLGKAYTRYAQKLLRDNGIEVLESAASISRAGDEFHNLTYALNYANGIHSTKYQRYIAKELWRAKKNAIDRGDDVADALKAKLADWKDQFAQGKDFWNT
ncbi:fibronectin type III domain-containing protein [Roseimaritima ulvae]|nr:fibronectin type III domain-containing protein [Roseimaritima ulvae]